MALNFSLQILTLIYTIFISTVPHIVTAVPDREIESMIEAMRDRGYNLFGNAITTSDIHYEVLAGTSFTFFVPTDSSLFALDMTATSSDYITNLRYHVIPRRLSVFDLRNLRSGSSLRTLVPRHNVKVELRRSVGSENIVVDGVDIVVPGLFYGRDIAVHGLAGILSFRSPIGTPPSINVSGGSSFKSPEPDHRSAPPPQANLSDHDAFEPPITQETTNPIFASPVPEPTSLDGFSPADSPEIRDSPMEISPAYGFWPYSSISPAPSALDDEFPASPLPSIADRSAIWNPMRRGLTSLERYDVSLVESSDDKEGLKAKNGVYGEMTPMDLPEIPWPLDSVTVNCPANKGGVRLSHHVIYQQCDRNTF